LAAVLGLLTPLRPARILVVGYTVVSLPVLTWYVFDRYFTDPGWSGRPVTADVHGTLDWVDAAVGAGSQVTIVPYAVSSDWFVSQRYWRDLEFWNRSVARDVAYPSGSFEYTGFWFPKVVPHFDPRTGAADVTLTRYVVISASESRFRVSGAATSESSALLIDTVRPWRLDWSTAGLYDDGWSKPHTTARVRVYAAQNQAGAQVRSLTIELRAPVATSVPRFLIGSNLSRVSGAIPANGSVSEHVNVCVSREAPAEVDIATPAVAAIPGDLGSQATSSAARRGGLQIAQIGLADELGGACRPRG
jgi:hypothetical protein